MKTVQSDCIWIKHNDQGIVIEFVRHLVDGYAGRSTGYPIENITQASLRRIQKLLDTSNHQSVHLFGFLQMYSYHFSLQEKQS